jgi:MFS family permease
MSPGQFYGLEMSYAAILLMLEVGTGRFSDRFGRVLTLKLGFVAHLMGCLLYATAGSFSDFLVGEAFFALGISLHSGTDEAFLFQSIKALKRARGLVVQSSKDDPDHQRWWTFTIGCGFVAMGLFSFVGTLLSTLDLTYPFWFAAGFQFFSLLLCFFMVEPPVEDTDGSPTPGGTLREALASVRSLPRTVLWMIIVPAFIVSVTRTFVWSYRDIIMECKLGPMGLGYAFAFFNFVAGVATLLGTLIKDDRMARQVVWVVFVGVIGSALGLVTLAGPLVWLVLIPQQIARSLTGSLFSQTINETIPDRVRATVLSIKSAMGAVLYIAALTPWWLGIEIVGRHGMFGVNLAILSVGAVVLWYTTPRESSA